MMRKIIKFIKYNNATVLILAIIFLLGSSVLATETGRDALGKEEIWVEGIDNTLLIEADLDNMNMDYRIEKIESDDEYYYVTYTFINLVKVNNAWQYQLQEKTRKVSKRIKKDLGLYLAEELSEEYNKRINQLQKEKDSASEEGVVKRVEVIAYSGLIGQTLDLAGKIFPNYEPVEKRQMPSPPLPALRTLFIANEGEESSGSDNLTEVYLDYIRRNDPDEDNVFGINDNCPDVANSDQLDSDEDGEGDACDDADGSLPAMPAHAGQTGQQTVDSSSDDDIIATSTEAEPTDSTDEEDSSVELPTPDSPGNQTGDAEEDPDVEIIELPETIDELSEPSMPEETPVEAEEPTGEEEESPVS